MSIAAKRWLAVWLVSILAAGGLLYAGISVTAEQRAAVAPLRPVQLPLSFAPQREAGRFLARGAGYSLSLAADGATFGMRSAECGMLSDCREQRVLAQSTVLQWSLVKANPQAQGEGLDLLPGRSNYLVGRDPRRWRTNVPNYGQARFRGVYLGIDVTYYGNGGQLEYDFTVAPGADPRAIKLAFAGADKLALDNAGNLVITLKGRPIIQRKPFIYQQNANGTGLPVSGGYVLKNGNQVAFEIGPYDTTKTLIIDPLLAFSTYLGGSNADQATAVAVDYYTGKTYLTGVTLSSNFPVSGGVSSLLRGASDVFVSKLNAAGTALEYSTYIGGDGNEEGLSLALDAAGNAYVTGTTDSANFPTTSGSFRANLTGGRDAFVVKLNPNGNALAYGTYLGGSGNDDGYGLAVDLFGNAFITGITDSDNFPVTNSAFQPSKSGSSDAFLGKLNASGSTLSYATYLGGNNTDWAFGVATDLSGAAYLTGLTASGNFPVTSSALQTALSGGNDGFVAKINPLESGAMSLKYATYLGGNSTDWGFAVGVDTIGHAYLAGLTNSANFPTTNGAFQPAKSIGSDGFVAKMSVDGTALSYATFLGGNGSDYAQAIAVTSAGQVVVAGNTQSSNFPVTSGATQPALAGKTDAFLSRIKPDGTGLLYSSYLGGANEEAGLGVAQSISGNAYLAGDTVSTNFPVITPYQSALGGSGDAFAARIVDTATTTPIEDTSFFVRQHYLDFLSRDPDAAGLDFWIGQIVNPCGGNAACISQRRVAVSNAFFFELEFQQTGSYVYRLYRAAYGNTQPFPNPETATLPGNAVFVSDRAQVVGGAGLAASQLALANAFVQRPEFLARYPNTQTAGQYVDALINTIQTGSGANLTTQRDALITLFNTSGRGAVLYRLADDNAAGNPINNRAFIDAEYNRAFVSTQYFGYLRRDADLGGFNFWLSIVNGFPLRSATGQNAMVCAFITSAEYQERFGGFSPRSNGECPPAP